MSLLRMSMPNTTETSTLIRFSRKLSKNKNAPIMIALFKWKMEPSPLWYLAPTELWATNAEKFHKELALKLSIQRSEKYSITLNWIRTHLAFSILHSSLLCLRDTRVGFYAPLAQHFEFACGEAHILQSFFLVNLF